MEFGGHFDQCAESRGVHVLEVLAQQDDELPPLLEKSLNLLSEFGQGVRVDGSGDLPEDRSSARKGPVNEIDLENGPDS
jgi:hypothetical protein